GTIYFLATDAAHGTSLWKAAGTGAGAAPAFIKDFGTVSSRTPRGLIAFKGALYFSCQNADGTSSLWRSDGTAGGTVPLATVCAGGYLTDPYGFTVLGDKLFFEGTDAVNGPALWVSDGTAAGTKLFKDTAPGSTADYEWAMYA